jgi:dTDP-4-amino-4,6-dideoxygalactose transaminase
MNNNLIKFNEPPVVGTEINFIKTAIKNKNLSGDGQFTKLCHNWFNNYLNCPLALLTPSCTHALEMIALLLEIKDGDEVIMPSYTFVSTANAFVLHGAKIVFVDINPNTMNIDETTIEGSISDKTKAIVIVHYAGVSCNMDHLKRISRVHQIPLIEDSAQAIMSEYNGVPLGSIGDMAAFSFHETKNITSGGEGGALIINNRKYSQRAEIIREKGTNRSRFFRGMVDKYTWVDKGSSYLPSEIQAAYLYAQLCDINRVTSSRLKCWNYYYTNLNILSLNNISLPTIPKGCKHNGHIFYIKVKDYIIRQELIEFLRQNNIWATFHYIPLHTSTAGLKYGIMRCEDKFTTVESEKLLRLPIYYGIKTEQMKKVVDAIKKFYSKY